jgi:hypothetical protein
MSDTNERIMRKREVRQRIPVGATKFEADIVPRLIKVRIGPRIVGFTESSVNRLVAEMIAASADAPAIPSPNRPRRRGRP